MAGSHRSIQTQCGVMMKRRIHQVAVVLASATGILALFETSAHAMISLNHCEPLR
jgi:hypothetical protein